MEQFLYTCRYCNKEFVPKRRKVQKFCSTSCRVRNHQISKEVKQIKKVKQVQQEPYKETVNLNGAINAFLGTAALGVGKKIVIPKLQQPATKADIKRLEDKFERYQRIENQTSRLDGKLPYFDSLRKFIVYF